MKLNREKLVSLLFLLTISIFGRVWGAVIMNESEVPFKRKLADDFEFTTDKYFDTRTGVLRLFMEDLLKSTNKYNPEMKLNSILDADDSYTTGNKDPIENVINLIPNTDFPMQNEKVYEAAREFQQNLKSKFYWIQPDLFSEDPNTFIGNNSYYMIVKKRGILFYYLSRIVFYGLLIFLLMKLLTQSLNPFEARPDLKTIKVNTNGIKWFQFILILTFCVCTLGVGLLIEGPRDRLSNTFTDILFRFNEIKNSINIVIDSNNKINKLNLKIPSDKENKFHVQNQLTSILDLAQSDVQRANNFLESFPFYKRILNLNMVFVLVSSALLILVLDKYSSKTRSYKTQFLIFIIATLSLSYLFYEIDDFFSGFSGINDFCLSMMRHGKKAVSPFQGYGISPLLGCSISNRAFQQLYINIIAQNSALKIFNNEMYRIGRSTVQSTDEALDIIKYLDLLEASDSKIDKIGKLIQDNTETIKRLLDLSKCSPIREWINTSQRDLCLISSKQLLWVFIVLLVMIFLLIVLVFVSYALFRFMIREQNKKKAINFVYKRDVYQNIAVPW